jgi:rhodanese-related sulfurtransferase
VAVRGALIALFDDDGVRARMTGSWLAQMGWDVAVVEGLPLVKSAGRATAPGTTSEIGDAVVVDLAPSPVYAKGHIPGAWFLVRSRFAQDCGQLPAGRIVVTSPDGWLAHYAAGDLARACGRPVEVLAGGTAAYTGELECECRWASPAIDVYKRPYEGTDNSAEAMRAYLEWEYGLVAQVANDGIANFRVIR